MSILALDLGTKTGWALRQSEQIFSGVMDFKGGRYEGGGMRFLRFRRWLNEQWKSKPNVVYYEEVRRHLGTDAAHIYGGLLATLTAWCEEHQIPYSGVPVGTIKKFITGGKGNANKEAVITAVQNRGHTEVTDDNHADALALLYYVLYECADGFGKIT